MDIRKKLQASSRRRRKKGDTAQLAAQLAPLEELDRNHDAKQLVGSRHSAEPPVDPDYGAIVVSNESLNLPRDIVEGSEGRTFLGMEPVVLVILIVMLAFIGFIAWQVSLMPAQ